MMKSLAIGSAVLGTVLALGSQDQTSVRASPGTALYKGQAGNPPAALIIRSAALYDVGIGTLRDDGMSPRDPEVSLEELTAVIQRNCVACHNDQLMTGNFSLQGFDVAEAVARPEAAEKAIHKLRLEMMPPPGVPRPAGDTLVILAKTLEDALDVAASAATHPGARRFQRLSVGEYELAIQDLLGLKVDASVWFPPDIYLRAYDTWSDIQQLSLPVVEGMLQAASAISRLALGSPTAETARITHDVRPDVSQHEWDHVEGTPYGTRGGTVVSHNFPVDGDYIFSVSTALGQSGTGLDELDISVDGEPMARLALPYAGGSGRPSGIAAEDLVRASLPLTTEAVFIRAGQRQVAAAFVRNTDGPYEDPFSPHEWSYSGGDQGGGGGGYPVTAPTHLRGLTISGPHNPIGVSDEMPSRQRIFRCRPATPDQERPCAESIITALAVEAYRRPLTVDDRASLLTVFDDGREQGGFEVGIRRALQAILSSPSFFLRLEGEPAGLQEGESYALSDLDVASRLSFFLWGTGPDQELRDVAAAGALAAPELLEEQVRRMLSDPRSEALATRFASQWLRTAMLEDFSPHNVLFPGYHDQLKDAMRRETELFFDHLVREDRSFFEFLTAEYKFVNDRLARHYGIPYTGGEEFRRVKISDPNRFGILGHASMLAQTSFATRTSPVKRGEWVMEVLMESPPPPPPPNVPDLDETAVATDDGRLLTIREQMEMHRANPTCNSCHQFIDPIGLALENYDPVGQWRVRDKRRPLDSSGRFYDGTMISTPADLREVLLKRPEVLARAFTKNLLAYAIGRPVEYSDQPAVRAIVREAEANGYRMSSFILSVAQSDAFRMRTVEVVADDDSQE